MIIHIDIDAFFASLEELRHPEYSNKPLVVAIFTHNKTSGAVATANYKAREYGVTSGMPLKKAQEILGDKGIFIEADKKYYESISNAIYEFLKQYGKVEKASIDEFYIEGDRKMAEEIKEEIWRKFKLTCSVGIGPNKLLAKMAAKKAKPNGIYEVKSIKNFENEEVSIIPGIGKQIAKKLRELGIKTIKDLQAANPLTLKQLFGKQIAKKLKEWAFGIGESDIHEDIEKNAIGKIITLPENTRKIEELLKHLSTLTKHMVERLEGKSFSSLTLILFLEDYSQKTKSKKIMPTNEEKILYEIAKELLEKALKETNLKIRRLGVFVAGLSNIKQQKLL